jgi:Domain of unknown function (DUF5665)
MKKGNHLSEKELAELSGKLKEFYEMTTLSKRKLLWISFLRGLGQGFGVVVGGTIIATLFLWVLSQFNHIPLISPIAHSISESVQNKK